MANSNLRKTDLFALLLVALLIAINLFVAINYYFIGDKPISQFFIWQTNIENPHK